LRIRKKPPLLSQEGWPEGPGWFHSSNIQSWLLRTLAFVAAIFTALVLQFAASSTAAQTAASLSAPLLPDGNVNLGPPHGEKGVWEINYVENMANYAVGGRSFSGKGSAAETHVPFLPWSAAVYDYNVRTLAKYDPESFCLPPGGPRLFTAPYPMEIIQLPNQQRAFIVFEVSNTWREIHMDGRAHTERNGGTFLGDSVGRYENGGKTLTIDVTNFNEGTWLDFAGHPHSSMLHVVEKFTRASKDILHYEALIDDPGAYSRPWTVAWDMKWWPDGQLDEYVCDENNRYIWTLKDDLGAPLFWGQAPRSSISPERK
jgi:hypothetical protein